MSILVVGSVAFDDIKTPFGERKKVLGGSATYFSVSASFFSPVSLIAVVGEDFTEKNMRAFRSKNVDTRGLTREKGKTFTWSGEYGWDFNNPKTLATHLNVFATFSPNVPEAYKNKKYVFLANIDPEIQKRVLEQIRRPKFVACDTMNYWIENKRKHLLGLLKKIDMFLLNESEARELTEEPNLLKAARTLLKFGCRTIIIKKGENGALLFSGKNIFSAPAFLMESIFDPTGAGDTFAGGVMGYLAKAGKVNNITLRKALVYGTVMATFAVEDFGLGRLSKITKKDITERIRKFRKLTFF